MSSKSRKIDKKYPNTSPIINSLSITESIRGIYTVCFLTGLNFSKNTTTGNSTITFGPVTNIPVTFYSSLNISFVVPVINIDNVGTYNVQVINNNYPTSLFSNIVEYTLLSQ